MTSLDPVRPLIAPLVDGEDEVVSVPEVDEEDPQVDEEVQQEDGDQHEEAEIEEAVRPIALRDPGQPTTSEREEHELTHLPPRPWCDCCMRGRAQHDQHRTVPRSDPV